MDHQLPWYWNADFDFMQVASDSGISDVGINKGTNQPGEKGIGGPKMDPIPDNLKDTRGV